MNRKRLAFILIGVIGLTLITSASVLAAGTFSFIGGGENNLADGNWATVGGGSGNSAKGKYSAIIGGWNNLAKGNQSTIGGGRGNIANKLGTTISGGKSNRTKANYATVGGGRDNQVNDVYGFVGGGQTNQANGAHSTVAGGWVNNVIAPFGSVGGGFANSVNGEADTVSGGYDNTAFGRASTVAGGEDNVASADHATIGGGEGNSADDADHATIGGGLNNSITGTGLAVGTGSTVGGGENNLVDDQLGTIGGGRGNQIDPGGGGATIGGGLGNSTRGMGATVPGGEGNEAGANHSFAAGKDAKASHRGSFVWNAGASELESTSPGQFLISAPGGVGVGTTNPQALLHVAGDLLVDGRILEVPAGTIVTRTLPALDFQYTLTANNPTSSTEGSAHVDTAVAASAASLCVNCVAGGVDGVVMNLPGNPVGVSTIGLVDASGGGSAVDPGTVVGRMSLNLPDSVTVKSLSAEVFDGSITEFIQVRLHRVSNLGSNNTVVNLQTTTAELVGTNIIMLEDACVSNCLVENDLYDYFVTVVWDTPATSEGPYAIQFRKAVVEYET